jgi:hypothetical protein
MHRCTTRDVPNTHRVREGGFELRRKASGAVPLHPPKCMFPQVTSRIVSTRVRRTSRPSAGTCDQSCDHFAETALDSGRPTPVPHPRRTDSFSTPGGGEDRGRRTSWGNCRPAAFRAPVRAGSRDVVTTSPSSHQRYRAGTGNRWVRWPRPKSVLRRADGVPTCRSAGVADQLLAVRSAGDVHREHRLATSLGVELEFGHVRLDR